MQLLAQQVEESTRFHLPSRISLWGKERITSKTIKPAAI